MPPLTGSQNEFTLSAGASEAQYPALAGQVLHDELRTVQIPSSPQPGEVAFQFRVVRSTQTGLLDFYFGFTTPPASALSNVALTMVFPLRGLQLLFADFRPDGLGASAPDVFEYFNDGGFVFGFTHGVPLDTRTKLFFVSTNAKEFTPTAGFLWNREGPAIPGPSGF
jgi:hypothetical protein